MGENTLEILFYVGLGLFVFFVNSARKRRKKKNDSPLFPKSPPTFYKKEKESIIPKKTFLEKHKVLDLPLRIKQIPKTEKLKLFEEKKEEKKSSYIKNIINTTNLEDVIILSEILNNRYL